MLALLLRWTFLVHSLNYLYRKILDVSLCQNEQGDHRVNMYVLLLQDTPSFPDRANNQGKLWNLWINSAPGTLLTISPWWRQRRPFLMLLLDEQEHCPSAGNIEGGFCSFASSARKKINPEFSYSIASAQLGGGGGDGGGTRVTQILRRRHQGSFCMHPGIG